MSGLVSLVGAGPGDPDLLTLRGMRRLQQAEVVVYDRLTSPELLEHCAPHTRYYDVGKAPGCHPRGGQEEINRLLVQLGLEGRRVVRLKGGDPFVFGRGGEEALALARAGVPFEVVPGVSAALAAPAAVGVPATHRGMATSVTIATGHDMGGAPAESHDWGALARLRGTLVFLMVTANLGYIADRLIQEGCSPEEPAVLVQSATTSRQAAVFAPLREIAGAAISARLSAPVTLVVGPTVELAEAIGATLLCPADEQDAWSVSSC